MEHNALKTVEVVVASITLCDFYSAVPVYCFTFVILVVVFLLAL